MEGIFFNLSVMISLGLLSLSLVMTFIRLIKGPSLPDRVVCLDLIIFLVVGFISVYSISQKRSVFLDSAIALALIGFLGTIAFAKYIEIRGGDDR